MGEDGWLNRGPMITGDGPSEVWVRGSGRERPVGTWGQRLVTFRRRFAAKGVERGEKNGGV